MGEEMYSNLRLTLTSGTDCSGFFGYYPTIEGNSPISNALAESYANVLLPCRIEKVIFHDPATIVYWKDKTKTVVKCHNEPYDPEKGLAMCIAKKVLGDKFHQTFREWCEA